MLILNNISKSYHGLPIFKDFSCSFENAGLYVITGESGSGKTTLLEIITGFTPFKGNLYYNGEEITKKKILSFSRNNISFVVQNPFDSRNLSIRDSYQLTGDEKILSDLGLLEVLECSINDLSVGQKQRHQVAISVLEHSPIIIADEPLSGLDLNSQISVGKMLMELSKKSLVIVTSHNEEVLKPYSNKIISLDLLSGINLKSSRMITNVKEKKDRCYKEDYGLPKQKPLEIALFFIISLLLSIFCLLSSNQSYIHWSGGINPSAISAVLTQNDLDYVLRLDPEIDYLTQDSSNSLYPFSLCLDNERTIPLNKNNEDCVCEIFTSPYINSSLKDNEIILEKQLAKQLAIEAKKTIHDFTIDDFVGHSLNLFGIEYTVIDVIDNHFSGFYLSRNEFFHRRSFDHTNYFEADFYDGLPLSLHERDEKKVNIVVTEDLNGWLNPYFNIVGIIEGKNKAYLLSEEDKIKYTEIIKDCFEYEEYHLDFFPYQPINSSIKLSEGKYPSENEILLPNFLKGINLGIDNISGYYETNMPLDLSNRAFRDFIFIYQNKVDYYQKKIVNEEKVVLVSNNPTKTMELLKSHGIQTQYDGKER